MDLFEKKMSDIHRTISEPDIMDIGSDEPLSIFVIYCMKSVPNSSFNYILGMSCEYEEEFIE
jgi:hypothetical protein